MLGFLYYKIFVTRRQLLQASVHKGTAFTWGGSESLDYLSCSSNTESRSFVRITATS